MLKQGDKFDFQGSHIEGEILGCYPCGQDIPTFIKDGAYQVIVGGFKGLIAKPLFDNIFKQVIDEPIKVVEVPKIAHKRKVVK
jgi:hypothetical protein